MAAEILTVTRIDSAKPRIDASGEAVRTEIPDRRQSGLYLVVQPSGKKSWAVRYRFAGAPKKLTLGPYPGIELKKARRLAGRAFETLADGKDPSTEKRKTKDEARRAELEKKRGQRDLFENVAIEFIERYAKPRAIKKNRPDAWKESARILGLKVSPDDPKKLVESGAGYFVPQWRGRKIQDITKRDVVERLEQIADGAPIMANRAFAAVRKLMNWAVGRDVLAASPCTGVQMPSPERARDRVLDDDELRLIWLAAAAEPWPYGPLLMLLILTGQREAEVAGLRAAEIDKAERVWRLAGERVKNDEQHFVPLSDAAFEIMEKLNPVGRGKLLFSLDGEKPVTSFSRFKERIDEVAKAARGGTALDPWVFHDLRRTMVSGMARLGISLPVIERCINHKSGSFRGIVGVYQRFDFAKERRQAFEAWAAHVTALTAEAAPSSNVIQIREAAREGSRALA